MIHLVYPYAPGVIAAPWSIGNHLGTGLREAGYQVRQYDWMDTSTIRPNTGDVLLGHPHPEHGYIFGNSCRMLKWSGVIAMTPWGGLDLTVRMIDRVADYIDHVVLICGPYWADRRPARWGSAVCVDMAIDESDYPRLIAAPSDPGRRRFLYVGCCAPAKGTDWLRLVAEISGQPVTHVGHGAVGGPVASVGVADFRTAQGRAVVAAHDFILGPGVNDANPTALLEGLSWGLHPLARETCGWTFPERLPEDPRGAAAELLRWQGMPTAEMATRHGIMRGELGRFTWRRLVDRVLAVIPD